MKGKQKDFKRRKRKPERRCIGVYHEANAVEWKCAATVIAFVRTKREPNNWTPNC